MRPRFFFSLAALTVMSASSALSQTTPPPPPVPAAPVPAQQIPLSQIPSRPPYDPDLVKNPAARPAPQPGPPPVLIPRTGHEPPPPGRPKYSNRELMTAYEPYGPYGPKPIDEDNDGSVYIPVDNWIYPEMLRLYGMGFVDTTFLSMRPWTRKSVLHMLYESQGAIAASDNAEAQAILDALLHELEDEQPDQPRGAIYGVESVYTRLMGVGGNTLRDSYHLGQTINNDYGRPYQRGFNNITGFSSRNEWSRFSLYVRGEYQHAPSGIGYSPVLSTFLSQRDTIPFVPPNAPQDTIPSGPIAAENPFRLVEANASVHLAGHEISFGKNDAWLGPGYGSGMAWSNNAENIYTFRVNRVEPLSIPLVSRLLGPVRYDFFAGSLKGHSAPNDPWIHSEMFTFAPTANFQFGFQRSVIWGGKGHVPINLHSFLRSVFSISDTTGDEKFSTRDPGARFSAFNFSYRLPIYHRSLTFYADSITHDDVTPPSAPRRAAYRPGIYLSRIPKIPKLDLRVEAVNTDFSTHTSDLGSGNYWEAVQVQGYTNKGFILGDWIGREAKGGQAWLTYHLSGNEWVQLEYLNKKTPKDFIPGGTTQHQLKLDVVKRLRPDIELHGWVQVEQWKAPIYLPGQQRDTTAAFQITFFPKLKNIWK